MTFPTLLPSYPPAGRRSRSDLLQNGSRVAVAFVPAAQMTPPASEYIARSTAIGCVDVITAPNVLVRQLRHEIARPHRDVEAARAGSTVNVFVTGAPFSRRNVIVTGAAVVPGFASRM